MQISETNVIITNVAICFTYVTVIPRVASLLSVNKDLISVNYSQDCIE